MAGKGRMPVLKTSGAPSNTEHSLFKPSVPPLQSLPKQRQRFDAQRLRQTPCKSRFKAYAQRPGRSYYIEYSIQTR